MSRHLVADRLRLFGPGPTNMPDCVCHAMNDHLLSHLNPNFLQVMDYVRVSIGQLFQTSSPFCACVSGTGHAGMECAMLNLLQPKETVVVCNNGIWGHRFSRLCERSLVNVHELTTAPGQTFSREEIKNALQKFQPDVLFVVQGESSSGAKQDLSFLAEIRNECAPNCLILVDAVASAGGVALLMDQWQLDCIYSATQKCLACPPGLSPIAVSEKGMQKILSRTHPVPSFYFDMVELMAAWGIDKEGKKIPKRLYHHTFPITLIYGVAEGLRLLLEEGVENAWKRHEAMALTLGKEVTTQLGLELFVPRPEDRLACVTTVVLPEHWSAPDSGDSANRTKAELLLGHMRDRYKVEIAGGLGPTAGKVIRIGLMGPVNATNEGVQCVVNALRLAMIDKGLLPANRANL